MSKLKFIPDWRLAWKFLSVQAAMVLALLSGIQGEVLPVVEPLFPPDKWPVVSGGLALLIVVLRVVSQDSLKEERWQLELEALEARLTETRLDVKAPLAEAASPAEVNAKPTATTAGGQPMPPGRLEQWLGSALLFGIVALLALMAFGVWVALRGATPW